MNDQTPQPGMQAPLSDPVDPGSDEALSAYLHGELDEAGVAAFEARLASQPALAAQLDALAEALVVMSAADEVALPDNFAASLGARLSAEREVASLEVVRARRERRTRWSVGLSAAAVVALAAVASVQVLRAPTDEGTRVAVKDSAPESVALEAAPHAMQAPSTDDLFDAAAGANEATAQDDVAGDGAGAYGGSTSDFEDQAPTISHARMRGSVVIADDGLSLDEDAALLDHFQSVPEGHEVRGAPADEASEIAARNVETLREAGPFASGVRPDSCLDSVSDAGKGPRPIMRVERLEWRGEQTLAYLVATIGEGSTNLDRFELHVVASQDCTVRQLLTWD